MKVGRESDVRLRRVEAVGLGHRARQDFARGMHRHVALSRGSLHGILPQDTVTGHCHRAPVTGHCNMVPSQGTVTCHPSQGIGTGYCHRIPSQGTRHWKHCHESLPRINAAAQHTAAYKQRHPG